MKKILLILCLIALIPLNAFREPLFISAGPPPNFGFGGPFDAAYARNAYGETLAPVYWWAGY